MRRIPEDVDEIAGRSDSLEQSALASGAWRHLSQRAALCHRSAAHFAAALQFPADRRPVCLCHATSRRSRPKSASKCPCENGRESAANVDLRAEIIDGDGKAVLALTQSEPARRRRPAPSSKLSGRSPRIRGFGSRTIRISIAWCARCASGGETVDSLRNPARHPHRRAGTRRPGFFINGRHLKLHGWGQKPTDEWPGPGRGATRLDALLHAAT